MKYIVGGLVIAFSGWLFIRLATIEAVQKERARLSRQHFDIDVYRETMR